MGDKRKGNHLAGFQIGISTVLSVAIFVIIAIIMSCGISLVFKVDILFWASSVGGTIVIILAFVTWLPTGEMLGLKVQKVQNGINLYNKRANYIVDHQMFDELKKFCDKKNESTEKEIITEILSTQVIPYRVYELKVKFDKTEEEKAEFTKLWGYLTDKQKKLVNKVSSKKIKFERLVPRHITIGKASKHTIVNHNRQTQYMILNLSTKAIWGIFTTCFTYFVVIKPNDTFGIPQVVMISMWLCTFLFAIFKSIRTGYKAVTVYQHTYNLEQAELCAEFFKFCDKNLDEVDRDEEAKTND